MRARVVAELEQQRRWGALWARRRAWSYGLAAVAVALLVMLALRTGRTPQRRAPVVAANHQPVVVARKRIGPPPHRRVVRHGVRSNVPATPDPEPLIVKLQTDDPDVVIYWIADRKKGE